MFLQYSSFRTIEIYIWTKFFPKFRCCLIINIQFLFCERRMITFNLEAFGLKSLPILVCDSWELSKYSKKQEQSVTRQDVFTHSSRRFIKIVKEGFYQSNKNLFSMKKWIFFCLKIRFRNRLSHWRTIQKVSFCSFLKISWYSQIPYPHKKDIVYVYKIRKYFHIWSLIKRKKMLLQVVLTHK